MRVSQYTYFAVHSKTITAEEVAERLGLRADEVRVRGSKDPSRDFPRFHSWMIVCRDRGLTVTEQVERVLERVRPHEVALAELAEASDDDGPTAQLCLQIVRAFGEEAGEEGEEDDAHVLSDGSVRLAGQHQLLGWGLDTDALHFLTRVRATVDVDEYG